MPDSGATSAERYRLAEDEALDTEAASSLTGVGEQPAAPPGFVGDGGSLRMSMEVQLQVCTADKKSKACLAPCCAVLQASRSGHGHAGCCAAAGESARMVPTS